MLYDNNAFEKANARKSEIDAEISKLRREYSEIRDTQIATWQERLKPIVGLCFEYMGKPCVITDIPRAELTMMDTRFDPYEIPVLFIGQEISSEPSLIPVYEGNVYVRAADHEDAKTWMKSRFKIIPSEEFRERLESEIHAMIDRIFNPERKM